ncbi:MAG TPA: PD-(D/E)XK nuclease family protein, partial [Solirubrobacterales bacterium]|nr:PD-(D/E)XK nuclease family protein [Solirubrobacterales bacterium]
SLLVGPPNSGRADAVMERFRAALASDPVLVVPTAGDVAEFERELAAGGATLGGSIATFDALAGEIVRGLAPAQPPELTVAQREALVRAAIASGRSRHLRRSAARPGFAPALSRLIAELEAALITPAEFERTAAELDDADYERELAAFYRRYVELREASGHGDRATTVAAAIAALRSDAKGWAARPVFVYGFDDLTRAQLELLHALSVAAEVVVAVTFADRLALAPRAGLISALRDELGAEIAEELPFEDSYTDSATLRHLDRHLFEPGAGRVAPDDGLVLLQSAGARGEAEAVGVEIARLLRSGFSPDEIAIVVRHPDPGGRLLAGVLREMGIPVALEASLALSATAVGGSLIALCRAARDDRDIASLLVHLRLDPTVAPGAVDTVESRIRRGEAQTVAEAVAHWDQPPRHLERQREATTPAQRLRALARSARELAEGPHRKRAPLARESGEGGVPFSALELRAGVAAAELLTELADLGELPECEVPDLDGAVEAIESSSVPLWRGPATGRVRILDPYRARAIRVRALFCLSLQDGSFPSAAPPDPLLSEERRREIGNPDLRRTDPADEERYLFHSCVSRPTDRLYLSWQSCDEDGTALAPSPFLDEVRDLLVLDPEAEARVVRKRGPERAVPGVSEATSERALARALALGGWSFERQPVLTAIGLADRAPALESLFAPLPDPNLQPGPLRSPVVLAELGAREVFSANSLEGWVTCSYKWFVEHELSPQRLEPTADPLWLGSLVHDALERLYRDPPGVDSIPRPGDVAAWQARFAELLDEIARSSGAPLNHARRAALERARAQVDAFLATEAETETDFRPRPDLLEVAFGPFDEGTERDALTLGGVSLRGRIDRIDVDPAGRAVVRDYKTGKSVAPADKFGERGTLQIQLYMLVAERILGLDPVAGLYHPLGAVGERKPRGIVAHEHEELKGLGIVGTDRRSDEELKQALADAETLAVDAAREMRAGEIRRNPIGGSCPKYCTFQAICRLERAIGVEESGNGGS